MEESSILRPIPRRTFEVTPASTESSAPPTPSHDMTLNPNLLDARLRGNDDAAFKRSRSIMNLTSSTLFGIYAPTACGGEREEPSTPWGTGAETPNRRTSTENPCSSPATPYWWRQPLAPRLSSQHIPHLSWRKFFLHLLFRTTLRFILGAG